jgi:hypothetical protein
LPGKEYDTMNDEPCNYCGTPINKNHDCIDALRSQLAEKDKEIERLMRILKDNDIPTGDNEFLRGA